MSGIKDLLESFRESLLLVLNKKILLLVALFWIACNSALDLYRAIFWIIVMPTMTDSPYKLAFAALPFMDRIAYVLRSVNFFTIIDYFSITPLFGIVGTLVASLLLIRQILNSCSKSQFIQDCCLYLGFFALLGGFLSSLAVFFFINPIMLSIGMLMLLFSMAGMLMALATVLEGAFLYLIKAILRKEPFSNEKLFMSSKEIFPLLFIFNLICGFISPKMFTALIAMPDSICYMFLRINPHFATHLPMTLINFGVNFLHFVHSFILISFIFVPILLAMRPIRNMCELINENFKFIRNNFTYYVIFVLISIVFLVLIFPIIQVASYHLIMLASPTFGILTAILIQSIITFFAMVVSIVMLKKRLSLAD